jgi:hypothetical protein
MIHQLKDMDWEEWYNIRVELCIHLDHAALQQPVTSFILIPSLLMVRVFINQMLEPRLQ